MFEWNKCNEPEDAGISSKGLLEYLEAVEKSGLEHHSILILRHGRLACRMNFSPYDDQTPHMLFSLSKTFTSAAAGFAVAEGLLHWEDRVLDVLKDAAPLNPDDYLKKVNLHHLLTMGSGLREESDREVAVARNILEWGCSREPGTYFHYNSHGTYLVSCMIQKVTGQTVRDYLEPRLFRKLGIPTPEFDLSPEGVCFGGWGLHLSSDSIARFGQCLLNKGMWEGEQLLPEEWIALATQAQIDNSNGNRDPENDWHQGYGYQIWRTRGGRYRGDGMYGQVCMISEEKDMVVAVTAGLNDMSLEMQLLHQYLFPAADMEQGTEEEREKLKEKLKKLSYPWPQNDGSGKIPAGCWKSNGLSMMITEKDESIEMNLEEYDKKLVMGFGLCPEKECQFLSGIFDAPHAIIARAGWKKNQLVFLARMTDGPFTITGSLQYSDNVLHLQLGGIGMKQLDETFVRKPN